MLRTSDAVSRQIEPSQVMASMIGFGIFYSFLGILDIYLLAKSARKGPLEGAGPKPTPLKEA